MLLRLAEDWDLDPLMQMLVQEWEEHGIQPLNFEKARAYVGMAVAQSRVLIVLEAEKIIAGLGLAEVTPYYSDASLLKDFFYYVRPEHRGDSAAQALLDAYKSIAQAAGKPAYITKHSGNPLRRSELFGFLPFGFELRVVNAEGDQASP